MIILQIQNLGSQREILPICAKQFGLLLKNTSRDKEQQGPLVRVVVDLIGLTTDLPAWISGGK